MRTSGGPTIHCNVKSALLTGVKGYSISFNIIPDAIDWVANSSVSHSWSLRSAIEKGDVIVTKLNSEDSEDQSTSLLTSWKSDSSLRSVISVAPVGTGFLLELTSIQVNLQRKMQIHSHT